MNSIYKFDFDVNEDILLLEYDKIKHKAKNYIDNDLVVKQMVGK